MEPDQPNQPSQPDQPNPLFNAPYQNPMPPVVTSTPPPADDDGGPSKKVLLIAGGAGLALLLILIVIIVLVSGSPSKPAQTKSDGQNAGQSNNGPEPATAAGVQLMDGSISQDISSLNEEKDFAADKLSDENLDL